MTVIPKLEHITLGIKMTFRATISRLVVVAEQSEPRLKNDG